VRLAAAFVIARHGNPDTAWPVLAAGLAPEHRAETRLEALNYLTNLNNRPAMLRPLIEAAAKSTSRDGGENYVARAAEHLLPQ
jgi:hypothetical protein